MIVIGVISKRAECALVSTGSAACVCVVRDVRAVVDVETCGYIFRLNCPKGKTESFLWLAETARGRAFRHLSFYQPFTRLSPGRRATKTRLNWITQRPQSLRWNFLSRDALSRCSSTCEINVVKHNKSVFVVGQQMSFQVGKSELSWRNFGEWTIEMIRMDGKQAERRSSTPHLRAIPALSALDRNSTNIVTHLSI